MQLFVRYLQLIFNIYNPYLNDYLSFVYSEAVFFFFKGYVICFN